MNSHRHASAHPLYYLPLVSAWVVGGNGKTEEIGFPNRKEETKQIRDGMTDGKSKATADGRKKGSEGIWGLKVMYSL